MTLRHIVYDIREALKEYSDDSELSNSYIIYLLNIKREKYIKQKLERFGRSFDTRVIQSLCLDTEEVSSNECGLALTCSTIVRTKQTLPDLIQLSNKDALQRVGPADKLSIKYNLIPREKAPYFEHSPFKNKIKAFLHDDDRIYLISSEPIMSDCISITGIFSDPTQLENYKNCCNCDDTSEVCYDLYESEYPIQSDILELVRQDIINELAKLRQIPEDKINNSEDDN